MAWNDGLSDGFWGAVSANVGQAIGAASGTTNHQADAQIAMANQNRAEQQQQTSFLQGFLSNNSTNSTNGNLLRSGTGQNNNQMLIVIAVVVIIVIGLALRRR